MEYHRYHKIKDTVHENLNSNKLDNLLLFCQQNNVRFVDKEFPPNKNSLVGNPMPPSYGGQFDIVEWKRADELFQDNQYDVFRGITPSDIRQGALGNCYFLCSLASLAEYPDLIRRLFDFDTSNEYGIHAVWLNINGAWKRFILDEYFPAYFNGAKYDFAFSKTDHQKELWVILLEKAYAKAYGSYWEIIGGDPVHALRDLTGAPYDRIDDYSDLAKVWDKLYEANKKHYMMTCFTKSTEQSEEQLTEGLVSGHAYTILDVREIIDATGAPARILQIRNPWGKFEWNGDFSDNSNLWTAEHRRKFDVHPRDDGVFWMRLRDFVNFFEGIGILEIVPGYVSNAVTIENGGKTMLRMSVDAQTHLTIGVDQMDSRVIDNEAYSYSYIRLTIARIEADKLSYLESLTSAERNSFIEKSYPPGEYLILVEPYWSTELCKKFNVSTYSNNEVEIELLKCYEDMYAQAEYRIWKDFARRSLSHMPKTGSHDVQDGYNKARIDSYQFKNKKLACALYTYYNNSKSATLHRSIEISDKTGFDELGYKISGDSAELFVNPGDVDILLMKMDPRSRQFNTIINAVDEELINDRIEEDKSFYSILNNLGGKHPTPDNPKPNLTLRSKQKKNLLMKKQRRSEFNEQLKTEQSNFFDMNLSRQEILENERREVNQARQQVRGNGVAYGDEFTPYASQRDHRTNFFDDVRVDTVQSTQTNSNCRIF